MSRLDDMFDDFISKAKGAADVAGKKTTDVVEYSKLKYQVKQAQWDIEKSYARLGAFVYESKNSDEDFTDLISLAINEIDLLNDKLERLEQQIRMRRNVVRCSDCGKENDLTASYCARCGSSLTEDKARAAEQAAAEQEEDEAGVEETMDELNREADQNRPESPEE